MADPALGFPQYGFGVFTVDVRAGELRKHGVRVKLQELPFQLLVALLERPGELVTRDELRRRLWPDGTFVDFDHSISSALNKLRGVLNDSARTPRYIETVGRRGYRFIYPLSPSTPELGNVIPFPAPVLPPPRRNRWVLPSAGLVLLLLVAAAAFWVLHRPPAPAGPIRSIAVLPLKNLSSDPEQEYFSEGLTDELLARLALIHDLRVISRTSVMQYKDSTKPLPQIARELNVDAIVEGSVLRADGRVRITTQLIEAASDRHIWAESYERDERGVLALQGDVARDIAQNIRLSLDPADRQRLAVLRSTDPQAHDDYLRGRFHWSRRTEGELRMAIRYFEQAITREPGYAPAYAGLADCYALLSGYSLSPAMEFVEKARAAAEKALQLDPDLAEAHTSLALIREQYDWDWQGAEKEFKRAIELDPNYATAHQWYAEYLMFEGRFPEALTESARARNLDPLSLIIASDYGAILLYSRQYDRAIQVLRQVLASDPDFPRAHIVISAYVEKGEYAEALADLEHWRRIEDSPESWMFQGYIYGRQGRMAEARAAVAHLEEYDQHHILDAGVLMCAYLGIGEKEKAFALLQKAFEQHSNALASLKVNPLYDPLRDDPRFQDLLRRVHLDR